MPPSDSGVFASPVRRTFVQPEPVLVIIMLGLLSSFIVMSFVTSYEILPILVGFLGLLMIGSAFIMLGVFISSITESQIVAGVISFGTLFFFLVIPWAIQTAGPFWGGILKVFSVVEHFDSFAKGVLDTADITYFMSFFIVFLFLTLRILESKKWRG